MRSAGAPNDPPNLSALLLGWLLGGTAFTEKRVKTPQGEAVVAPGQVWGSVFSMVDDILVAVGESYTPRQARYALARLTQRGLVADHGCMFPSTRGLYGKVYAVADAPADSPLVDVARAYRLFHYGDPADFRLSEIVVGDPRAAQRGYRNRVGLGTEWVRFVAQHGSESPAFTNVGRWRRGEVRQERAPVFVPWLTADLDRDHVMEAYEDALAVGRALVDYGCDPLRTFVSFSGRRGFHFQVSADQIGNLIYRDSFAAAEAARAFFEAVADGIELDSCTYDPRQLVRLTGSRHERTGFYKRTWALQRFLSTPPHVLLADLKAREPFAFPDPTVGEVEERLVASFEEAAEAAARAYDDLLRRRRLGDSITYRPGDTLKRVLAGVGERECWSDAHCGRNEAAFILAMWLHEGKRTGDAALDALSDDPEAAFHEWNRRNRPPLPTSELTRVWRNAARRVSRNA